MTLREQIHADVEDVFLNVDNFGETFYYLPAGGTRREIVGVVTRERSEVVETQGGMQTRHELEVFVSRDSTTGIDEPKTGDALWRKSLGTSDPQGFSFGLAVEERDENDGTSNAGEANGHTLLFLRYTPFKHGGLPKA